MNNGHGLIKGLGTRSVKRRETRKYDQPLDITGFDIDPRMIKVAQENAVEAGFMDIIKWQQGDVQDLAVNGLNGVMIGNPPYGERLGELEEAEEITRVLGQYYEKASILVCIHAVIFGKLRKDVWK